MVEELDKRKMSYTKRAFDSFEYRKRHLPSGTLPCGYGGYASWIYKIVMFGEGFTLLN